MNQLKLVIPKGSIQQSTVELLNDAGYGVSVSDRSYIPLVKDEEMAVKMMRPQNIPRLVELGSHDVGIAGHDWVLESGADVVEVLDLKTDPVKIVVAVPQNLDKETLKARKVVVATEYENIAEDYLRKEGYDYVLLRSYGATEVFPPDDADMIIDNTATGTTITEHDLKIIDTVMNSSTVLLANKAALEDAWKAEKINEMKMLFQSIVDASGRVMLEMNVPPESFEEIIKLLPCMRSPTVSPLYGDQGYAVKVAVPRADVKSLIPQLKKMGAMDILEYEIRKIVP